MSAVFPIFERGEVLDVMPIPLFMTAPISICYVKVLAISACLFACESPDRNILKPADAPLPLSPKEALAKFTLPPGFRIELVASEPLIQEPTAVCWDERGRLYVSELHGYNLEGQLEIDEMNKAGVLDTVVQRIQAADKFKEAARAGTRGAIKRLTDTDGDGVMDKVEVLTDNIPPAYGLCVARGGIIVAGQTEIVYVGDLDQDGRAEIIDTLFTGFQGGALERGINAPQWGPEGWIYFGGGSNGGTITGPYLKKPVKLPGSNFRIRADGSAIEPVTGRTHTIGHAFTEDGDSFFTNTWKHALYAIPIPWQYLMRNPDASINSLEANASDFSTVFPKAPVHPWKLARSNQPKWRELYNEYGLAESAAAGYFTSCCSPLIYQDTMFPSEFRGNLFVCEPAQCFVHRSLVEHDGTGLKVHRSTSERDKEFLTSTDSWFRPVSISHAPDGSLFVVDMYREIIEDYSAVPRFMQQQYGLNNGIDKGRIWRVSPVSASTVEKMEVADMTTSDLEKELESEHYWRRQTANRLLHETKGSNHQLVKKYLIELNALQSTTPQRQFIQSLREQDVILKTDRSLVRKLAALSIQISDERILLQLALSLGYSEDDEAFAVLVSMARNHAGIRWMPDAIMTGMHQRSGKMLSIILASPGKTGHLLVEPLAASIAAGEDETELSTALIAIEKTSPSLQTIALTGLNKFIAKPSLSVNGKKALNRLLKASDVSVQGQALDLAVKLNLGDPKALTEIRDKAIRDAADVQLTTDKRLSAIALLANTPDSIAAPSLLAAWKTATPPVKAAILDALISRGNRLPMLMDALESKAVAIQNLSALQQEQLLERADGHIRPRAEALIATLATHDKEVILDEYAKALAGKRNSVNGEKLFKQMCATCHQVKNIGLTVGPDLKLAYANSEETILRSVLWPNEKISSGYDVYTVTTLSEEKYSGILVSESANSIVLRQAGGIDQSFLRKDVKQFTSSPTSLMPMYGDALSPQDCADIIEWLKSSLKVL